MRVGGEEGCELDEVGSERGYDDLADVLVVVKLDEVAVTGGAISHPVRRWISSQQSPNRTQALSQ